MKQPSFQRLLITALFSFIFCFQLIDASTGDRLPEFKSCLQRCISKKCTKFQDSTTEQQQHNILDTEFENTDNLPFYLRALFWDCPQNCDYICQQVVTKSRKKQNLSIEQFHGKWPFIRVFGIQELFSLIFSIMNFIPHYKGFKLIYQIYNSIDNKAKSGPKIGEGWKAQENRALKYLCWVYMGTALTGMNAWTWSSVFHVRDFILTERLDYFSAGLTVLYSFYTCFNRVFVYPLMVRDKKESQQAAVAIRVVLSLTCIVAYFSHVYYLQFVRFDYGYNMLANVVVGIIQTLLWIYHGISDYAAHTGNNEKGPRKSEGWRLWPVYLVLSILAAMSFELLDFAPFLGLIDAHALWHAGTVLPTYGWYAYMKKDLKSLQNSKIKE